MVLHVSVTRTNNVHVKGRVVKECTMLENFLSNLKSQSWKMSDSFTSFKSSTDYKLDNFKSKFKESSTPDCCNIEHNPIAESPSPLTPIRSTQIRNVTKKFDLKWPIIIDNQLHWVPHVPDIEENELVDRFTRIVNPSENITSQRCNDREEIRRRLAMGSDGDEYYGGDRPGRKPSLQARLQSGMNLQICFMNETMSDTESPNSDTEANRDTPTINRDTDRNIKRPATLAVQFQPSQLGQEPQNYKRPSTSLLTLPLRRENEPRPCTNSLDFYTCQAQLQAEARLALAQAKEMAHMQMEIERQRQKKSPITEMVRSSLEKVGISFPEDRRRLSRQILTEMNVAQLQVIVNDLHTQIELLNDNLVKFLMDRDDLHMEQDSMLVDIEDLTRYLGAKEKPDTELLKKGNSKEKKEQNKSISLGDRRK